MLNINCKFGTAFFQHANSKPKVFYSNKDNFSASGLYHFDKCRQAVGFIMNANVQLEMNKAVDISSFDKQEVQMNRFNRIVQFELIGF